jgi:tetratricopeptide (TPR) repeat protein
MKPSNYLLSLFFSLFCNIIVAQNDYIYYYNYCNEGDEQFYLKNYALALKKYDSAFQSVDFIHTKQLNKYAQTCIKVGDTVKAIDYVRKALINGLDTVVLYQYMYTYLKGNIRIFELKDSTSFFHNEYQKRINQNYSREVDSLQYIDQCIIRRNCEEERNFKFKYENIQKNKLDLDSLVFSHLIFLVKKYGFPSEKLVGSKEYNIVWVIFHHNVRLPQNEKYIPMVEEAVRKGEIDPSHFAWMYDQGKLNKNEKPFFFYGVADVSSMTEAEMAEIDARRKAYGIKPLRSTKIEKTEGSLMQISLW